jgi:hypothetical protein
MVLRHITAGISLCALGACSLAVEVPDPPAPSEPSSVDFVFPNVDPASFQGFAFGYAESLELGQFGSEDANGDGVLDPGEDLNGNGLIDRVQRDFNNDGAVDENDTAATGTLLAFITQDTLTCGEISDLNIVFFSRRIQILATQLVSGADAQPIFTRGGTFLREEEAPTPPDSFSLTAQFANVDNGVPGAILLGEFPPGSEVEFAPIGDTLTATIQTSFTIDPFTGPLPEPLPVTVSFSNALRCPFLDLQAKQINQSDQQTLGLAPLEP